MAKGKQLSEMVLRYGEPEHDNPILNTETGEFEPVKKPERNGGGYDRILWEVMEDALNANYIFLYNEISHRIEYAPINGGSAQMRPITDRDLYTIVRTLQTKERIKSASGSLIKNILSSDFAPAYNPIKVWFEKSQWDGRDHIAELAGTIKAQDSVRWNDYLKRWLVATVANAVTDKGCQNHTCLVLIGAGGKGKTTWFNTLLPAELLQYYFVGKVDVENKDSLTLLAEKMIVNIDDQLASINRKDEDQIKTFITLSEVTYRRAYSIYVDTSPRIASICGSVNHVGFLSDATGNRRFLPIIIEDVDLNRQPLIPQVWAQAYSLFKSGFKSHFGQEELDELNKYNEGFRMDTVEYEFVQTLFRIPEPGQEDKGVYLTNSEIVAMIQQKTGINRISGKEVGKGLKRLGLEPKNTRRGSSVALCYHLIPLDLADIQQEQLSAVREKEQMPAEIDLKDLPF